MNILLTILAVIVSLIALFFIIALFVKKNYSVSREMIIDKPREEVFEYIRHLKNQNNYSMWVMMDPNMKKSYRGTDGTVGFVYAWEGNKKAGKGEQEIKKIVEGQQLDIEVRFIKPFEALASTPFITEKISDQQTKVRWGMSSAMNYPMNFMLLFMNMDKLLGSDLEISLTNLKKVLEGK